MATQTQTNDIQVPALMDGDNIVIPQFCLAENVEYRRDRDHNMLSAAEYNSQMTLPTLAELRHAFFGESKDYRKSVLAKCGYGEWTSTFLQDDERVVENPENVVYRNGVWVLEGGKVTHVKLPPNGWTLEYNKLTGFPSKTSLNREDAKKVFDDNTSYFCRSTRGIRVVLRASDPDDYGPFHVFAYFGPDDGYSFVGGRACRRTEQAAKHLATPIEGADTVTMSLKKYMTLMENYRQLSEAHQRVGDFLAGIKVQK